MIETPHGLQLVEETEHPKWLQHHNISMQKTEEALAAQDGNIQGALTQVGTAVNNANIAIATANEAKGLANTANDIAQDAADTANEAVTTSQQAVGSVQGAIQEAQDAAGKADAASLQAQEVYGLATSANASAQNALSVAGSAQTSANQANTAAGVADGKAVAAGQAAANAKADVVILREQLTLSPAIQLSPTTQGMSVVTAAGAPASGVTITESLLNFSKTEDDMFFKAYGTVKVTGGVLGDLYFVQTPPLLSGVPAQYVINGAGWARDNGSNPVGVVVGGLLQVRVTTDGRLQFAVYGGGSGQSRYTSNFIACMYLHGNLGDVEIPIEPLKASAPFTETEEFKSAVQEAVYEIMQMDETASIAGKVLANR